MGMDTIVIATKPNYGSVGFGWEVDTRLAPLMLLGDCGRPNIGFAFHDGMPFHLVVYGLVSSLCKGKMEATAS